MTMKAGALRGSANSHYTILNVIAIASVLIKKEAAVCHAASLRGMYVKSFTTSF